MECISETLFYECRCDVIIFPIFLDSQSSKKPIFLNSVIRRIVFPPDSHIIIQNFFFNCIFATLNFSGTNATLGKYVAKNCQSLKLVILPKETKLISPQIFVGCDNLNKIEVDPNNPMFFYKNGLSVLDNILIGIDDDVKKLEIDKNISYILNGVLQKNINISEIIISNNSHYCIENNVLYSYNKSKIFMACGSVESVKIDSNICLEISKYAFCGCSKLRKVVFIGSGINKISEGVFARCRNLSFLELNESIQKIEAFAFEESGNLLTVTQNNIRDIGYKSFYKSNIYNILFSKYIQNISTSAFEQANISVIDLSDASSMNFGTNVFSYSTLENITFPSDFTEITKSMFKGCRKLKYVKISSKCLKIAESSFECCLSPSLSLELNSIEIGRKAFYSSYLNNIVLINNYINITNSAFERCRLNSITFKCELMSIGDRAFYESDLKSYYNLENVDINRIYHYAFSECKWIREFKVPKSLEELDYTVFINSSLEKFSLSSENKVFQCDDLLYKKNQILWLCPPKKKIAVVQGLSIAKNAFLYCDVEVVDLRNSYIILLNRIFEGCCTLRAVYFPRTLQEIGDYAFKGLSVLTEVIFDNTTTLEKIGYEAFRSCLSLKRVDFVSVKTIENNAFMNCRSLESIRIFGINRIGSYAFRECFKLNDFFLCSDNLEDNKEFFLPCPNNIYVPIDFVGSVLSGCHITHKLDSDCLLPTLAFTSEKVTGTKVGVLTAIIILARGELKKKLFK